MVEYFMGASILMGIGGAFLGWRRDKVGLYLLMFFYLLLTVLLIATGILEIPL